MNDFMGDFMGDLIGTHQGDFFELTLRCICTAAVYFLSNYYTYNLGTSAPIQQPLFDVFHDILPDLSKWVSLRDIILPIFFIPLFFLRQGTLNQFMYTFVEGFMYLVTLKAITIFFTFLPPSNTKCAEKRQINHCFHQIFSGHNSFTLLACILFTKYIKDNKVLLLWQWIITFAYSFFILMTRAHYSVDIIVSYIIVLLLID